MTARIKVEQFEQMTTHELADVLTNFVLLLRRMPDVKWQELQAPIHMEQSTETTHTHKPHPQVLIQDELKKMTVADLKEIAKDLHIPLSTKIKKDELISRILARQDRQSYGHSEQYAIQEI